METECISLGNFSPLFSVSTNGDIFFTGEPITDINPKRIQLMNFNLLFSDEYEMSFKDGLSVLSNFIYRVICDLTIIDSVLKEIYLEILEALPSNYDKREYSDKIVEALLRYLPNGEKQKVLKGRIDLLYQLGAIYSYKIKIF